MKAHLITTFAMLFASTCGFGEDTVNRAKLREAAQLPKFQIVNTNFSFNATQGIIWSDGRQEAEEEIADLEKSLKHDDSDASRLARLADLYGVIGNEKKSTEVYRQSAESYRRLVDKDPKNGRLLAEFALNDNDNEKDEKLLRQAIELAPQDWYPHFALGQSLSSKVWRDLGVEKGDLSLILNAIAEKQVSDEQIIAANRSFDEAIRCYDRAIVIAPKESEVLWNRILLGFNSGFIRAGLQAREGKDANAMAMIFSGEMINDLRKFSQLRPNDCKIIGMLLLADFISFAARDQNKGKEPLLASFPVKTQQSIRTNLQRLGRLAEGNDNHAALAAQIQGLLCVLLGERKQAEAALRRSVALNPKSDLAWDLLLLSLAPNPYKGHGFGDRKKDALQISLDRLKFKDTARSRFLVATIYAELEEFGKAEEQLREGIKIDPLDPFCNLGLAAMLLRREDPEGLPGVAMLLVSVKLPTDDSTAELLKNDLAATSAIYFALGGGVQIARELLSATFERDSTHEYAKKVQEAIGK